MRVSIRTRLFATVSILIVFFVAISWLLNSTLLEKFYVYQNKQTLISDSENIDNMYNGNVGDLATAIDKSQGFTGINIIILDQSVNVKYYSLGLDYAGIGKRPARISDTLIPMVINYIPDLQTGERIVAVSQDPNVQTGLINVLSKLNNGDYLLLSASLESIQESAAIANHFFFITGLLTILIGCFVLYFFARRFTQPILELNAIAQKMAELDFTRKYVSTGNDELGELGDSINSLSDQLDKSISELQAANQKLQEDIEYERRIDEMRKQFVSNVSHELKTPIALIQGYAEGLKDNVVEDEDNKNFYCDVITDEAARMNKIVRQLLDLSQIEAGCFPLEKETFDISVLIQEVLAKYDLIFKEEQIEIKADLPGNLVVDADRSRIEQVLVNYINNAIDHVNEHKQILLQAKHTDNKIRVAIANTGDPIPDEALSKLFTSFYKVDQARTRAYGGTGLGLSIVRAIMEWHHNNYGVNNTDQGVEFWFELDLEKSVPI